MKKAAAPGSDLNTYPREAILASYLVVRAQATGADVYPPVDALNREGGFVGIGLPHPVGPAFGVAYVVAELRPFAADFAFSWHYIHLLTVKSIACRSTRVIIM